MSPSKPSSIDASDAKAGMRKARREAGKLSKAAQLEAAREVVVPEANLRVPGFAKGRITAKATRSYATIGSRLPVKQDRILGLLEFGGTVGGKIVPRTGRALRLRSGAIVASVSAPRTYKPKRMLQGAIDRRFVDYQDVLLPGLMRAFDEFEHTP